MTNEQADPPKRVNLDHVEIAYDSFGSENGIPIVLVAGLGNQLISWREEFCHQLAGAQFYVIRFDNRDAGLSTRFDQLGSPSLFSIGSAAFWGRSRRAPYDLGDMAADVVGLLDHLGLQSAHIVGASLGGMISQALALEHPQRVRSLSLMLTSLPGLRPPLPRPRALILFSSPARTPEAQVERYLRVKRGLSGSRFPLDEDELRKHSARLAERSPQPPGTRRQLAAIAAYGRKDQALRTLDIPTLVIHGSEDPLLPPGHGRRLASMIPGAKLLMVAGLGHEFPAGAWPQVLAALRGHMLGNEGIYSEQAG